MVDDVIPVVDIPDSKCVYMCRYLSIRLEGLQYIEEEVTGTKHHRKVRNTSLIE